MRIFYSTIIVFGLSLYVLSNAAASALVKADADGVITLQERHLSYGPDFKTEVGTKVRVFNSERMLHISRVVHYKERKGKARVVLGRHIDKPKTAFTFDIDETGIYHIICLLHSNMKLEIIVD